MIYGVKKVTAPVPECPALVSINFAPSLTGRSTTTEFLYYIDECINTISNVGVVDSVFLEFSKAFDIVPHR